MINSLFLKNYFVPITSIHHIEIEPIAVCNLRCSFCQVPGWQRATETRPMEIDFFKKIIHQFPNLKSTKLQGMGEPFLNQKLTEMIKILNNMNIITSSITNGTVLNSDLSRKVLESGLNSLSFSFDGAIKKTYESVRINSSYEKVVKNMETICKLKNIMRSDIEISIICLASNDNIIKEIPSLIKLASEVGIDKVYIKKRLKIWKKIEYKNEAYKFESLYLKNNNKYNKIKNEATALAKRLDMEFEEVTDPDFSRSNPCFWPFQSIYISTEGKVVPCCALGVPETWSMGDLRKEKFKDIWNSKSYRKLRRRIKRNHIPDLCKACYRNIN